MIRDNLNEKINSIQNWPDDWVFGVSKDYSTYPLTVSIESWFNINKHERAIILGTGGASKALSFVLKNLGIDVIYISRNPNGGKQFSYKEINENMLNACKLVVNCTPVGTFPNILDCVEFPFQYLNTEHFVVDLVYNPEKTQLLEKAEIQGATILNGSSMLKHQALRAWEIWNNYPSFKND